ncbi:RsmB/NOP family class I SAM-dependent RNA methyltransferase [Alteraurantiacibacter aestuarii]|uniref:RsmB/NOP family class I SAM-dependent RNA methyltransferase n=1 Tax=Alteraurantiacibacter aestuarii TaxID=650004 RepID=UPI0031D3B2B6
MTPAARVQAAIEILDSIITAARSQGAPADRLLAEWSRGHRFAGSKDRRAIRELVYGAIRACGPVPRSGRAAMLRLAETDSQLAELFDGSNYGPPAIGEGETPARGGVAPEWLEARLAASDIAGEEADALLGRAPLDLRVNTLKTDIDALELPLEGERIAAPGGLRLPSGTQVEQWDAYQTGLVEVQDGGSQLACLAVGAQPGETVIDLCAGAGGKTIALAADMQNSGTLIAADTDRGRLSRLAPRSQRAGTMIAETLLLDPGREMEKLAPWQGKADAVLVDAPCSGTGTWRRGPEARWRLSDQELTRLTDLQQRLITLAAGLVKPGGRLIYVTCSLLDEEGSRQIEQFLAAHKEFTAATPDLPVGEQRGAGIRLTPFQHGTDGFFIACLCRA